MFMTTIKGFIADIEDAIEEIDKGVLKPDTHFRTLESWSSMHALIILAMIDTNYGVMLTGEEMRKCNTVSDLFDTIQSKK